MAIEIIHATPTGAANDPAYDVSADAWNEAHNITVGASRLVGRYAATPGAAQEVSIGTGLALDSGTGVLSATALSAAKVGARVAGGV